MQSGFLLIQLIVGVAFLGLSQLIHAQCQQGCGGLDDSNTFLGDGALTGNTTGGGNTAIGLAALQFNTTGFYNTATGDEALFLNGIGTGNTANGTGALQLNQSGDNNTAIGFQALYGNTSGSSNIALGVDAGEKIVTGSNNIDIGNVGDLGESGAIRIGTMRAQTKTFIAGINGRTVPTGVPVIIDTTGHLGTTTSSARFKEAIEPMNKASEAILALHPVTFRYKKELDPVGVAQFGLVAEEVEKVNPDLVARDEQGKPYTVRYEAVSAMLLNEFLKEHKAFLQEHRTVQDLKAEVEQQREQIEALTAGLQKISAQIELSKTAPQTVLNNR
jgi:hypothetical protein